MSSSPPTLSNPIVFSRPFTAALLSSSFSTFPKKRSGIPSQLFRASSTTDRRQAAPRQRVIKEGQERTSRGLGRRERGLKLNAKDEPKEGEAEGGVEGFGADVRDGRWGWFLAATDGRKKRCSVTRLPSLYPLSKEAATLRTHPHHLLIHSVRTIRFTLSPLNRASSRLGRTASAKSGCWRSSWRRMVYRAL